MSILIQLIASRASPFFLSVHTYSHIPKQLIAVEVYLNLLILNFCWKWQYSRFGILLHSYTHTAYHIDDIPIALQILQRLMKEMQYFSRNASRILKNLYFEIKLCVYCINAAICTPTTLLFRLCFWHFHWGVRT